MSLTTGNNSIDALLYSSWNTTAGQPVTLTYSFMTRVPAGASTEDANGFGPMAEVQKAGVRTALATWAAVANITFREVSANGNIQLGTNEQGTASSGYAYLPDGRNPTPLYLNSDGGYNYNFDPGKFGLSVLIHELGHTLGLKHPGDYNSTGAAIDGPFLPAATDNLDYTQMSYNLGSGFNLNGLYGVTPMLYDIQAMQYLYGANMSYHTGADTYSFVRNSAPQAIWDAGGSDTFDFSAITGATVINLNAGTFSSTAPGYNNISIAYNVTIERAIASSGGSTIYANAAGNTIVGGAGNDLIHLGAGSDAVTGGGGADTVVFAQALSTHIISGALSALTVSGEGIDTLNGVSTLQFSDATLRLSGFSSLMSGTANDDVLTAGSGNQLITGGAGIDLVKFSGKQSDFAVSAGNGGVTVRDQVGGGGSDLLAGVERIEFSDNSGLALDTDGAAGQLFRFYSAVFDRAPDQPGMGFWLYRMDHGQTLLSVATGFLNNPEFVVTYAADTSNEVYVTKLYNNLLNRAPDQAGFDWQVAALNNGLSRAQLLVNFSESAENIKVIAEIMPLGVAYTPWLAA